MQNNLWEENKIQLFKLTSGSDEFGVVLTDDYVSHIKARVADPNVHLTIGVSYMYFHILGHSKNFLNHPTPSPSPWRVVSVIGAVRIFFQRSWQNCGTLGCNLQRHRHQNIGGGGVKIWIPNWGGGGADNKWNVALHDSVCQTEFRNFWAKLKSSNVTLLKNAIP